MENTMKLGKKILLIITILVAAGLYSYGDWSRPIYNTKIDSGLYEMTEALEAGQEIKQTLVCTEDGLSGFSIRVVKPEKLDNKSFEWEILDTKKDEIVAASSNIGTDLITKEYEKKGILKFKFPKIEGSKSKQYTIKIVSESQAMSFYKTEKQADAKELDVKGQTIAEQSLVIKIQSKFFNIETFIVFLGIALYLIVFIKFMYKLFK